MITLNELTFRSAQSVSARLHTFRGCPFEFADSSPAFTFPPALMGDVDSEPPE